MDERWLARYKELKEFIKEHYRLPVQSSNNKEEASIALWMHSNCKKARLGQLERDKTLKLKAIHPGLIEQTCGYQSISADLMVEAFNKYKGVDRIPIEYLTAAQRKMLFNNKIISIKQLDKVLDKGYKAILNKQEQSEVFKKLAVHNSSTSILAIKHLAAHLWLLKDSSATTLTEAMAAVRFSYSLWGNMIHSLYTDGTIWDIPIDGYYKKVVYKVLYETDPYDMGIDPHILRAFKLYVESGMKDTEIAQIMDMRTPKVAELTKAAAVRRIRFYMKHIKYFK